MFSNGVKIQLTHSFENIISVDNLLEAWKEFLPGKRDKKDVQEFSLNLMDNIFSLHNDLFNHTYKHGAYHQRMGLLKHGNTYKIKKEIKGSV